VSSHARTLRLRQRRHPSRSGRMTIPGGRRAAGILGRGVRLTRHRTAAAIRERPFTPNKGHGAHRRCWPRVSRRWRVRHSASAGHLKRKSAPVERKRFGRSASNGSGARVSIGCSLSPHGITTNEGPPTLGTERGADLQYALRAYTAGLTKSAQCSTTSRGVNL